MDSSDWMMALGALAGGLGGYYGSQKKADREDARLNKLLGITDPTTAAAAAAVAPGVNENVNPASAEVNLEDLANIDPTHEAVIKKLQDSYLIGSDRRDVENEERFIYDEDGKKVKALKFKEGEGGKGLFDILDPYYNPVHNWVAGGTDDDHWRNQWADAILGLEDPEYNAEGELVKGDPNTNWANTLGIAPHILNSLIPYVGPYLGGAGLSYQALSAFDQESAQELDKIPGKAWEGVKNIFTKPWFPDYSEGYNTGGRVGYDNGGSIEDLLAEHGTKMYEDAHGSFGINKGPLTMENMPGFWGAVGDVFAPNALVGGIRDLLGMETDYEQTLKQLDGAGMTEYDLIKQMLEN